LVPINILLIPLAQTVGTDEKAWQTMGWVPDRAASYRVTKSNGSGVAVVRVEFPHGADGIDRVLAYLVLPADISTDDKLTVALISTSGKEIAKSAEPIPVEGAVKYGISLTPQAVPDEALANGTKITVGQFATKIDLPSITPGWNFARTYLTTDNVISTDGHDKKSKIDAKLGFERSILASWYLPVFAENQVVGDQLGKNLSYLMGGGFQTILPWAFTKRLLYNPVIQIPTSPTFAFDVKFEHRINQDSESLKKFPNSNSLRLHEKSSLKSWRVLPGLVGQNTAWIELNGEAWYLPLEEDSHGKRIQRLEGAGDVALFISLSSMSKVPGLSFITNSDPTHTALKIGYSGGANEANGFKHSRQPIFGIVIVK
jgi:hypothetical protein